MDVKNQYEILSDGKIGIHIFSKKFGTKLAIVDRRDAVRVLVYRWSLIKAKNSFYAWSATFGVRVLLHRLILDITDSAIEVDHRNHNGLDNRRHNIRPATRSQNNSNKSKYCNNTSGYKGVFKSGNKWKALIGINGKIMYLGSFSSIKKASQAYITASKHYHGNFGRY